MQFSDFALDERLLKAIEQLGYSNCTTVQAETLQASFSQKKDIYAQSQTGTGKTLAFLLPMLQRLLDTNEPKQFGLVVAPTRELADQISKEAKILTKFIKFSIATLYGGVGYQQQQRALESKPKLIIATPGRLIDFTNQSAINLKNADVIVLDEADRLFDMGFMKDVKFIFEHAKPAEERLTLLFSATLNQNIGNLAVKYMRETVDIVVKPTEITLNAVEQTLYHVNKREKLMLLAALLEYENPYTAIIFSNTKIGAAQVSERLTKLGYRCDVIAGNIPQRKRSRIINDLKQGKIRFLSATDVAARGLHVDNLSLVINYDLPDEDENYVHRIGRTARAGSTGKAISLACDRYIYNLRTIEKYIKQKIPVSQITEELQEEVEKIKKKQRLLVTTQAQEAPVIHREQGLYNGSKPLPYKKRPYHSSADQAEDGTEKREDRPYKKPYQDRDGTKPSYKKPYEDHDSAKPNYKKSYEDRDGAKPNYKKPYGNRDGAKSSYKKPYGSRDGAKPSYKKAYEDRDSGSNTQKSSYNNQDNRAPREDYYKKDRRSDYSAKKPASFDGKPENRSASKSNAAKNSSKWPSKGNKTYKKTKKEDPKQIFTKIKTLFTK